MRQVDRIEIERRKGYWQYALSKIERAMMQLQSKRVDAQQRIAYLDILQK